MKKTAVEYYVEGLENLQYNPLEKNGYENAKQRLFVQAKEMEERQHNETWDSAHQAGRFEGKGIAEENWQIFETYWEENFKSE